MTVTYDTPFAGMGSEYLAQAGDAVGFVKPRTVYAAVGLAVGSGAYLTGASVRGLTFGTHIRALAPLLDMEPLEASCEAESLPAAAVQIEVIRRSLSLSMSEIAKATGKSRQAVYKWLSGESRPEPPAAKVLTQLAAVTQRLTDAQVRHPGAAVKMALFSGQSILDLVARDELEDEDVTTVIQESLAGQRAYDRSGASRSTTVPSADWVADSVQTSSGG